MFRKLMSAKGPRGGSDNYQTLGSEDIPSVPSAAYDDGAETLGGNQLLSSGDRGGSSAYVPPPYAYDPPPPPTYNPSQQTAYPQAYGAGSYNAPAAQPTGYGAASYGQPPPQQYTYVGRPAADPPARPSPPSRQLNSQTLQMIRAELATVAECAEVLGDMCAATDANTAVANLTEVVGDLVELCRALKPHVLDIIEDVTDEGCLNLALTVHDDLTRVLQAYDKIVADSSRRDVALPLIDLSIDDQAAQAPRSTNPFASSGEPSAAVDPFASLDAPLIIPASSPPPPVATPGAGLDEAKVTQVKALTRRAAILLELAGGAGPRGNALMAVAGTSGSGSTSPSQPQAGVPRVPPQADLLGGGPQASSPPASPPLPHRAAPQRPAPEDVREWGCPACTYLHSGPEASFLACAVCGSAKP